MKRHKREKSFKTLNALLFPPFHHSSSWLLKKKKKSDWTRHVAQTVQWPLCKQPWI
jgi:hypothetical protein